MTAPCVKKWRQERKAKAHQILGDKCQVCGSRMLLECAHKEGTELKGRSRGSDARYADVLNNPSFYVLLCHDHHMMFDRGDITV